MLDYTNSKNSCLTGALFHLQAVQVVTGSAELLHIGDSACSYSLILMQVGTCRLLTDDGELLLEGNGCLLPPGTAAAIHAVNSLPLLCTIICFTSSERLEHDTSPSKRPSAEQHRSNELADELAPYFGKLSVKQIKQALPLAERLYAAIEPPYPLALAARLQCHSLLYELLFILMDTNAPEKISETLTSAEAAGRTAAYMNDHYKEPLSRQQLAEMAGLSPWYYSQLFKQVHGVSPMDYLVNVRMRHAKEMLLLSKHNLEHIAQQSGYSSEYYFSRIFKKKMGHAPTIYMKNTEQRLANLCYPFDGHLMALEMNSYASHVDMLAHHRSTYFHKISYPLASGVEPERNLRILRQARPYLIVREKNQMLQNDEHLHSIAPVFGVCWELGWRKHLQEIAGVLRREKHAEQWLESYEQQAADVRRKAIHSYEGATSVILVIYESELYLYGRRNIGDVWFNDLHMRAPFPLEHLPFKEKETTLEELVQWDADIILLHIYEDSHSQSYARMLQQDPRWQALNAVRRQRVYPLQGPAWREYSAYSHMLMLKRFDQMLDAY
ncbi:substrate-binding protein [Paenibacillus algorifonticola]|uniref:Substrate-binding protein n=1 Tax=Paenibacillus algorifonticola TaxID=684063 RepID=A0A1I2HGQ2_9BACL|nr:helix-turn-helix domain-containing protein [Paenibacillus algorifonticola]SFF28882.1 substrate-binding protein [Paenibacillus algorifonticola]